MKFFVMRSLDWKDSLEKRRAVRERLKTALRGVKVNLIPYTLVVGSKALK